MVCQDYSWRHYMTLIGRVKSLLGLKSKDTSNDEKNEQKTIVGEINKAMLGLGRRLNNLAIAMEEITEKNFKRTERNKEATKKINNFRSKIMQIFSNIVNAPNKPERKIENKLESKPKNINKLDETRLDRLTKTLSHYEEMKAGGNSTLTKVIKSYEGNIEIEQKRLASLEQREQELKLKQVQLLPRVPIKAINSSTLHSLKGSISQKNLINDNIKKWEMATRLTKIAEERCNNNPHVEIFQKALADRKKEETALLNKLPTDMRINLRPVTIPADEKNGRTSDVTLPPARRSY